MRNSIPRSDFFFVARLLVPLCLLGATAVVVVAKPVTSYTSDVSNDAPTGHAVLFDSNDSIGREPLPVQLVQATEEAAPTTAPGEEDISLRGLSERRRSLASGPATGLLLGSESFQLPTSDAGGFLGKSGSVTGIAFQARNPIVTDVRTRGNHVGQMLASGSYWVPARMDLDTMLSKIDPRLIDKMLVIKGPYSALYGPAFNFIDFELLAARRFPNGPESGGSTSIEFQGNGARWYGRQTIWQGDEDYGVRVGYGHKTGNDYKTGNSSGTGFEIPSSYNSRDFEAALGFDLTPDDHVEFHYLRLDQTDVEFPGMVFDMNFLVTDSFEVEYIAEDRPGFDRYTAQAWYNRTRFAGDTFGFGKNRQIPSLRCNLFPFDGSGNPNNIDTCILANNGIGNAKTDVDAMTTGFSSFFTWGDEQAAQLSLGTDLRYVDRTLNDIEFLRPKESNNFPIPSSYLANPGLLFEYAVPVMNALTVRTGGRLDLVVTDAENSVSGVGKTEETPPPGSQNFTGTPELITDRLKTGSLDRHFTLWSLFATVERELSEYTTLTGGVGFAQRAPTLTELYTTGSFINLLQSGLTVLTGDPELDKERLTQIDLGLNFDYPRLRANVNGFYSWIEDYITFDSIGAVGGLTEAQIGQKNNRVTLVNTDRATIAGAELFGEYDVTPMLTAFASMTYIEGRDHTRIKPSRLRSVGFRSGEENPEEPLPNISPLDTLFGLRLHSSEPDQPWSLEATARVVDNQDRVAYSLFERTTSGFTIINVRAYWRVTDNFQLTGGVENLTDKFYREHLDYRAGLGVFQPGINGYVGSELTY